MVRGESGTSARHADGTRSAKPPFPAELPQHLCPFLVLNLELVSHNTGASLRTSAHSYTRLKSAHR